MAQEPDPRWMHEAIAAARRGIATGQSPFGTVIVRDGHRIASAHNQVWSGTDPTAHAEVNAIRAAAAQIQSIRLSGCVLYSTCEPCPMCASAIHWAKLDAVWYGAAISDAAAAGFHELTVPAAELLRRGQSPVRIAGGVLEAECRALFAEWQAAGRSQAY